MPDEPHTYRLTDNRYLVLKALTDGPQHGYGLRKLLNELTDGRFNPSLATIYDALHTLKHQKLIKMVEDVVPDEGKIRRMYKITTEGAWALKDKERLLQPKAVPNSDPI
ncbi:MAG: helix-turn-helix transcriptional regulator [Chloroflexi bacterium]|nr:helix-turn-helix transcriptional regulator [Chloroflexota bacterium]